jgi:glycosyltransferase involved in cell wall biosynthesis
VITNTEESRSSYVSLTRGFPHLSGNTPPLLPRVDVLLSTYNGRIYLDQLLDSILAQQGVTLRIIVRDDASSDGTADMIASRRRHDPRIVPLPAGPNLGVAGSYFFLLEAAGTDADYVAFADQDDVWHPGKLVAAVKAMADAGGKPRLYCGRTRIVGPDLSPLGLSPLPLRGPSLGNALVENIATGCTVVMNRAARMLLLSAPWPRTCRVHDWWCYQVIAARGGVGAVIFDPEPWILYRQHDRNEIGTAASWSSRLLRKVRHQLAGGEPGRLRAQVQELLALHGRSMNPDDRALAKAFVSANGIKERVCLCLRTGIYRQLLLDDLALRVLILLGRI